MTLVLIVLVWLSPVPLPLLSEPADGRGGHEPCFAVTHVIFAWDKSDAAHRILKLKGASHPSNEQADVPVEADHAAAPTNNEKLFLGRKLNGRKPNSKKGNSNNNPKKGVGGGGDKNKKKKPADDEDDNIGSPGKGGIDIPDKKKKPGGKRGEFKKGKADVGFPREGVSNGVLKCSLAVEGSLGSGNPTLGGNDDEGATPKELGIDEDETTTDPTCWPGRGRNCWRRRLPCPLHSCRRWRERSKCRWCRP